MSEPEQELTGPQTIALEALVAGATITEAAARAGITRQTVSGWRNHHDGFREALEDGRADTADAVRRRIVGLCGKALEVLEKAMTTVGPLPDRIRAASRILDLASAEILEHEGFFRKYDRDKAAEDAKRKKEWAERFGKKA